MKTLFAVAVIALSGCAAPTQLPVDASPVLQGGVQLKTALGASVTGRDWNDPIPEAKDTNTNDSGDGK